MKWNWEDFWPYLFTSNLLENFNQHLDFPFIDSMDIQHCRVCLKLVLQESLTSLQHICDCFLKFWRNFSNLRAKSLDENTCNSLISKLS